MLEVLRYGPLARSELARRMSLSPASLTRLVAPLIDSGLLRETGETVVQGAGRPSRPVDVVPDSRHFVGVKLSHNTTYVVLTDLHARVLDVRQRPLDDRSPEAVAPAVAELVEELATAVAKVTAVGVGVAGSVLGGRTVSHAPFLEWDDVPLADILEDRCGRPVVVDNDVVALTKAEHWFGVGNESDRFAVLTVGMGVGYGLVVHDRVVEGVDASIGILGHFPVDPRGPRCGEGHLGCAAAVLSMPVISRAVSLAIGREVTYHTALDLAAGGDPVARAVVDEAGRALGRLIAAVANILITPRVVLADEGARLALVAAHALDQEIHIERHRRAAPVRLDLRDTGDEQWARGAAVSAIQTWVTGSSRSLG